MLPPTRSVFPFVAALGLCAFGLLLAMAVGAYGDYRALNSQAEAHALSRDLADASIEAGRERCGTLVALGNQRGRHPSGQAIRSLRTAVDEPWARARARLSQLDATVWASPRVRAAHAQLFAQRQVFEEARGIVDRTLTGKPAVDPVGNYATDSGAFVRALHEMRAASTSTQEMIGAVHRPLRYQALEAAEHASYERSVLAYHIAARLSPPPGVYESLNRERSAIEIALGTLKHASEHGEVDAEVAARISAALGSFGGPYDTLRRAVLDGARRGDFPGSPFVWVSQANQSINALVAVHDAAHNSIGAEITYHTRANLFELLATLAGSALTFFVSLAALRQIHRTNRILYAEKELAEVTLHSIGDAVITTDDQCRVEYLNPIAETLTGWRLQDARRRPLTEVFRIINALTRAPAENPASKCLRENRIVGLENHTLLISRDGTERHIEDSAAPVRDRSGRVIGAVVVFYDASQARASPHLLSYQATHDALTGLVNRREFERRVVRLVDEVRTGGSQHVLMFMDLDQFKVVNDTFGHVAGDRLLRQLAQTLVPHIGQHDTLARLGGDEFGLLFQSREEAHAKGDELLRVVNDFRFTWEGRVFSVGASIGAVAMTEEKQSPADLMSRADAACFVAKEKGRNRIEWYGEGGDMNRHRDQMGWVSRIQDALREGRFVLWAQDVMPLMGDSSAPNHREILVRMVAPDGELVLPGSFIPAAERYNLMPAVDRWVIARTIGLIGSAEGGLDEGQCFVNLSAVSLMDSGMPQFIRSKLKEHGVSGASLCFEVTETAAVSQLDTAVSFITALKETGCRFALDDFGSGMASFRYLKMLPVDILKIDGSFVLGILDSPTDRAMVDAINRVGKAMGLATVAEFVEDPAILPVLREIGVDYAQGYAIGRPRPILVGPQ